VKEFIISSTEYVERRPVRKFKNRKADLGEERTRRGEKQIGKFGFFYLQFFAYLQIRLAGHDLGLGRGHVSAGVADA